MGTPPRNLSNTTKPPAPNITMTEPNPTNQAFKKVGCSSSSEPTTSSSLHCGTLFKTNPNTPMTTNTSPTTIDAEGAFGLSEINKAALRKHWESKNMSDMGQSKVRNVDRPNGTKISLPLHFIIQNVIVPKPLIRRMMPVTNVASRRSVSDFIKFSKAVFICDEDEPVGDEQDADSVGDDAVTKEGVW